MNARALTLAACLLALPALAAEAPAPAPAPEEVRAREALGFADSLFQEKDYYRAISEYKRAAYLAGLAHATSVELEALMRIGESYRMGQKWEPAIAAYRQAAERAPGTATAERAESETAETLRLAQQDVEARDAFLAFLGKHPNSPDADRARLRLAACQARLGDLKAALAALDQVPASSPLAPEAQEAKKALEKPPELAPKKPGLAGGMSAILPGSGQWYAGRPGGGASTFLLNAALVLGASESFRTDRNVLGALLTAAALVAYTGNIYGAVGDAHKANREAEERFLEDLDRHRLRIDAVPALPPRIGDIGAEDGQTSPSLALVWTIRF